MEEAEKGEGKWRGVNWKSELEETKRHNGWTTALISKSSLLPLLVTHKGVS